MGITWYNYLMSYPGFLDLSPAVPHGAMALGRTNGPLLCATEGGRSARYEQEGTGYLRSVTEP